MPMRDGPESGSVSGDDAPSPVAATNGRKKKAKSEPSEAVVENQDEDEDEEDDEEVEEWVASNHKLVLSSSGLTEVQVHCRGNQAAHN